MAIQVQQVIQGNPSACRLIELTVSNNVISDTLGTIHNILTGTKITPNPGKPLDVSYTDLKLSQGRTIRAEQGNEVVSASTGLAIGGADLDNISLSFASSKDQREALISRARTQDPVVFVAPAGNAVGGSLTGWYYALGKVTDLSVGDMNDENFQTCDVTVTGSLAFSLTGGSGNTTFLPIINAAMEADMFDFGDDNGGTALDPTAIIQAELDNMLSGQIIYKDDA